MFQGRYLDYFAGNRGGWNKEGRGLAEETPGGVKVVLSRHRGGLVRHAILRAVASWLLTVLRPAAFITIRPPHLTSAILDPAVIHPRDGSLTFIPPTSSTLSFYTPTEPSCQVDNLLDLHFSQCRTQNPAMATVGTTPSPAVR